MGVIRCTAPDGRGFAIVLCAQSGSTSLRFIFEPWANSGQYQLHRKADPGQRITKLGGWSLGGSYKANAFCFQPRSWGFVRNPWKRAASRSSEKEIGWMDYVRAICDDQGNLNRRKQSEIVQGLPNKRIFDIDRLDAALDVIAVEVGLSIAPEHRRRRTHDWRRPYREHPETIGMVREFFADDWNLGFDWESPI